MTQPIAIYLPGSWEWLILAAFFGVPVIIAGVILWFALGRGGRDDDQ